MNSSDETERGSKAPDGFPSKLWHQVLIVIGVGVCLALVFTVLILLVMVLPVWP